jgi:hypothetical protein
MQAKNKISGLTSKVKGLKKEKDTLEKRVCIQRAFSNLQTL